MDDGIQRGGSTPTGARSAVCPIDGDVELERVDQLTARCRRCGQAFMEMRCTGTDRHLFWHVVDPGQGSIQRWPCPTCGRTSYSARYHDSAVAKLERNRLT